MDTVSFIHMADGTAEDYALLDGIERDYVAGTADRVLALLAGLEDSLSGYQVSRLEHSLQTATRAHRDGAEEEMVVAALLHDIGDGLAPHSHGEFAAAILRPFVSPRTHWIVAHHGIFQGYYYFHHLGGDRHLRERFRGHHWFDDCAAFCERWDQCSFDPDYPSMTLAELEPALRRVFAREPFPHERAVEGD